MHNRKWTNLSIVLVLFFSLFSPFASVKANAATVLHLLDITDNKNSTVLVWEVENDQEEEAANYQLIKNGEVLDITPVPSNETAKENVRRYSYEDQTVEKNTLYKYEIAATLPTGEQIRSNPLEHTFVGQAETKLAAPLKVEAVPATIKVVSDSGEIPWGFDFFIEGISEENSEVSFYGYLDEEGYFIDSDIESRELNLPPGTYQFTTYNYTTEEDIMEEFTIKSEGNYVTNPIEMVFPAEKLILKKDIKIEAINDQSISIQWDEHIDSEEVEKYLVYLNDKLVEEITDVYTTSYTYSGLLPETSYMLKVDYVYKDGTNESVSMEVTTPAAPRGEAVVFADEDLKNAIKNQLKIGHRDIYKEDMENLTSLDASYSDISNLTGLESAVNLEDLTLFGNQIEDLSPLRNLTNLVFLDLDENLITSLDELIQLTNLESLYLSSNQIEDITVLNELTKLTYVTLYDNEGLDFSKGSEDVEVLKNLLSNDVSVEWMEDSNEIFIQEVEESSVGIQFSFPGITDFISKYKLYLDGDLVAEIPVEENNYEFTNLKPITEYEISVEAVDSAGVIWGSAYNYVTTLPVPAGKVISFPDEALKEAVQDSLHISSRDIYESDMKILTSLDASDRGIEKLDGLEFAANLEELILDSNDIRTLGPITGLANLMYLSLNNNHLADISDLISLTNLEMLLLDNNEVKDISGLSQLTNLSMLSLQGNKIKEIQSLTGLGFEILNIAYNEIEDISSLLKLENLQYVLLMKNPLDLSEGSDALSVIQRLEDKGIMVSYEYLDLIVNKVTENSIEISWAPVTEDGYEDYLYYVTIDGEEVASDVDGSVYTINDLESDKEYTIEVVGFSDDFERIIYGTTVVKTAGVKEETPPEESEEPGEVPVEEGKAPSEQETPVPGKVTETDSTPEKQGSQKPGNLPNTATNSFNLILVGLGLVAAGVTFFAVKRRKVEK
ncbi:leucine-rich repeat domain-containing protein [Neobacillus niacini]|uniref:leucine-rich repeat domain-containing protein n=1 Tax=Neobacillus niacini TaxID=86668 RepID=UPI001C8D57EA|nr:leucine-rich repeat domain-containing protein [Neobacillus niacini]MBY0149062.1 leucine-rich repeat domain-containing protein [Neobacillus niacini]